MLVMRLFRGETKSSKHLLWQNRRTSWQVTQVKAGRLYVSRTVELFENAMHRTSSLRSVRLKCGVSFQIEKDLVIAGVLVAFSTPHSWSLRELSGTIDQTIVDAFWFL